YREKWKLPADYPMVAPNYARKRSELARATGLGKKSAAKLSQASAWSSADFG
ncbi:MucR family transcriptional regulator, partial [Sinorhizobium medicae]